MKTLLVVMSEQCNLNCSYCNVDKWSKTKIDVNTFIDYYKDQRKKYPDEMFKIDFFGGEPLLQFDVIKDIVARTEHDPLVKYFMPTNGLVITQEKLDFIIDKQIEVSLSFDGLWQDDNRPQLSGSGTLTKYLAKKDILKQIPNLRCHSMIGSGNHNLLENHLFIEDVFGVASEFTLVRDIGIWDKEGVESLKEGIKELMEWYSVNTHREMPFYIRYYLRHMIMAKYKQEEVDSCGAGESLFTFNEDNSVVPCNRFKDQPDVIAKIPEFRKMSPCQTCEVKTYCRKGCLYEQINNNGPIEELCEIYKYTYKSIGQLVANVQDDPNFQAVVKEEIENG